MQTPSPALTTPSFKKWNQQPMLAFGFELPLPFIAVLLRLSAQRGMTLEALLQDLVVKALLNYAQKDK